MNIAKFYGKRKNRPYEEQNSSDDDNYSENQYSDSDSDDEDTESSNSFSSSESSEDEDDPSTSATTPQPQCMAIWTNNFQESPRINFTGNSDLKKRLFPTNGVVKEIDVFEQFIDEEIINVMVLETNKYAQQYISTHRLRRTSRMNRWCDVTEEEMKKFLGVILATGLIRLPNVEDYWKKDELYYHPFFHKIDMTYNRFSLILKNWHVVDNQAAVPGDRLHKISDFSKLFIQKIQEVYTPGEEISVDETMIAHRGRLQFRQYNPGKAHKYGIKLFKLCEMTGYVWNFSVYCGQGTCNLLPGLDHSGSVVVTLAKPLLKEGRILVADNWYSSIPLATYLKKENTDYCGTLKVTRKGLPDQVKTKKLKKGEVVGMINNDGIRIMKYKDKKDIYMISTYHGTNKKTIKKIKNSGEIVEKKSRKGETILKPAIIIEYNRIKGGIDLSDQMISYYSPARKSVKWYRKVLFECIGIAILNSWVIYNKHYSNKKVQLAAFSKVVTMSLLGIIKKSDLNKPIKKAHELRNSATKKKGRRCRKRCIGCYKNILKSFNREEAVKRAKQVSTECIQCQKSFCLSCFNDYHK